MQAARMNSRKESYVAKRKLSQILRLLRNCSDEFMCHIVFIIKKRTWINYFD